MQLLEQLGLSTQELAGKVAVVTGAGRGIGREVAIALAALGAQVVVAEISEEGGETERIIRGTGGRALFIPTDVSSEAAIANLLLRTRETFGEPEILINNAILCPTGSVLEMQPEVWDRVQAVNLRGPFLACRFMLPAMLQKQQGTIINMVSADAMPRLSAYIASKQGLAAFSQSLAAEVGEQGVKVVALAPGFVETPGLEAAAAGLAPHLGMTPEQFLGLSLHPAYERAMPAEHAGAATAYLAARLAGEYHGAIVTGYTILERAGLLATPAAAAVAPLAEASTPDANAMAASLSERLAEILLETEAELQLLPFFVRPLARSGFARKAGMPLPAWSNRAARLAERLRSGQDPEAANLARQLPQLASYYEGVPQETARFTRDPELLGEVTRRSAERVDLIHRLMRALKA